MDPNTIDRFSKTKPRRKLKRTRAKARDYSNWRPERWVYKRIPNVSGASLGRRILDIVYWVLLEVWVVKQVERFGLQSQCKLLAHMDVAGDTEVEVVHSGSGE